MCPWEERRHTRCAVPIQHSRKRPRTSPLDARPHRKYRLHLVRPVVVPLLHASEQSLPTVDVRVGVVRAPQVGLRRGGGAEEDADGLRAEVHGIVCVGVEGGDVRCEEELGCLGGSHVFRDPVPDGDDGLFFGYEAAADIC